MAGVSRMPAMLALITYLSCNANLAAEDQFEAVNGLFEPSAAVQLPGGEVLVLEDEASHPLSLLSLPAGDQPMRLERPKALAQAFKRWRHNDLEGLAMSATGKLFAITSHSRNRAGKRDKRRERLLRFGIQGGQLQEHAMRGDLRKALVHAYPELEGAARQRGLRDGKGFSIEGLAFTADGSELLIGFREPVIKGKSMLVALRNPDAVFDDEAAYSFRPLPLLLDFGGGGIRDIVYDRVLGGYLVVTRREQGDRPGKFKLWFWSGIADANPRRVRVDGLGSLKRTEAIVPVASDGKPRLLLLSDDGARQQRKPANVVVLDYEQLTIKPPKPGSKR